MSEIPFLFAAMLTRNSDNSGTDSSIVFIMNVQGNDRIQYTFPDTSQDDQGQGQANFYDLVAYPETGLDTNTLANTYFRIGIRGDDAWRPEHFFLWGINTNPFLCVPLAMGFDLSNQLVERNYNGPEIDTDVKQVILSTDTNVGDLSFPLLPVAHGDTATPIKRLLMVMLTADEDDAGTNSTVNLQIANKGNIIVDFDIPDTPQADLERGQANLYFVPVAHPFVKNNLEIDSITLSIQGDDAWLPHRFALFGLDTVAGMPTSVVPLVHLTNWLLGVMSTDPTEGSPSVTLPIILG